MAASAVFGAYRAIKLPVYRIMQASTALAMPTFKLAGLIRRAEGLPEALHHIAS